MAQQQQQIGGDQFGDISRQASDELFGETSEMIEDWDMDVEEGFQQLQLPFKLTDETAEFHEPQIANILRNNNNQCNFDISDIVRKPWM